MRSALSMCVALALCAMVFATHPSPVHSQQFKAKIDSGPVNLDGAVGRDGVFPVSANLPTVILGDFTFNDPSPNQQNCLDQGWTTHDLTGQEGTYFHVDDFGGLAGGDFGRMVPIQGNRSLWCGARPANTPPLCEYATLPGYGNNWDQAWCTVGCLPVTGPVTLSFDMTWDMEPGYDFVSVEYDECDDQWTEFGGGVGTYDGFGTVAASHTIGGTLHNGNVRIRIRVQSDGAFSDEQIFNTDGACVIDNLTVLDSLSTVLPLEDFEGEAVGALASNDWNACIPESFGDFAGLFPGNSVLQEVATTNCELSCMWGFFSGSTVNYACGPGLPGNQGACDGPSAAQPTVMYQNANPQHTYNQYINNEIWSPWMTFSGPASYTTHLEFDVYRDLPLDNLVFYDWRVRTRSVAGGCPDIFWQSDAFVYYGGVDWHRHTAALDPFLGPTPAEIQVAIGVRDLCLVWCGSFGSGACHSHAPLFDNVVVYRQNTQSWVVDDSELFQDSFLQPGPGTTIAIDSPTFDYAVVRVTEPEFGIDYLTPGNSLSGPAVFCHVRNLPGKSGAIISGGGQYPEVPAMSTPEWTVLQMSTSFGNHAYRIDLNDALYEPGDTVSYYFSARDAGGGVSYFSHMIGRTDTEAIAQANPMEVTCLPAGGAVSSEILYVDDYSGFGAQPYFMTTFEALNVEVDRYDRNSSSSTVAIHLGDNVATAFPTLDPYSCLIWSAGTHGKMSDADYDLLWEFLHTTQNNVGVYLSGDDVASDMAASGSVSAGLIVSTYIDYTVTNTSHVAAGEPVSPFVVAEVPGIFVDVDTLVALGTTPALNDFDVIQPGVSAVLQASYSGNSANGAVVSQTTVNPEGANVTVIIAGFSFHHIRDDRPTGGTSVAMDRHGHMLDVLTEFGKVTQNPTGADNPALQTTLAQNVPNPFNPVTTISYSLRDAAPVQIVIYDVSGARVRTLVDLEDAPAGQHTIAWDGINDRGARVASGVYFYRMVTPAFTQTRKMVLLK